MTRVVMERRLGGGKIPSFTQLRAMARETDKMIQETTLQMKETKQRFMETDKKFQETDKKFQETEQRFKETERIVRQNSRQMGGLHRRFGEIAEHLVAPGIVKRFNELDYHFTLVSKKGGAIHDENGKTLTQIDILLENNELMIAVEVKTRPVEKDVGHHIKRIEILRDSLKKMNRELKILGAIAGAVFDGDVKEATLAAGFFVIEQSGDTMKIDIPEGWKPVEY